MMIKKLFQAWLMILLTGTCLWAAQSEQYQINDQEWSSGSGRSDSDNHSLLTYMGQSVLGTSARNDFIILSGISPFSEQGMQPGHIHTFTPTVTPEDTNTPSPTAGITPWTPTPIDTSTPVNTPTPVATPTPTDTPTPIDTPTPTNTSTPIDAQTPTPAYTATATPRTPQSVWAKPDAGYLMKACQTQNILAHSLFQGAGQANIRIHYQVICGQGRFGGQIEAYSRTGANAEAARAAFAASDQALDMSILGIDNCGLGGKKYLVILSWKPLLLASSKGRELSLPNLGAAFDTEAEARAQAKAWQAELDKQCLPRTKTPTPVLTSTSTPKPDTSSTPATTSTPRATSTVTLDSPIWLEPAKVIAYPNPAKGKANFAYTISGEVRVTIDIFRITGECVGRIQEYRHGGSGQTLSTTWNTEGIAPGIYIYQLKITGADGREVISERKKIALVK